MDYRLYIVYKDIRIINNMNKVSILIYYYIIFLWEPKSGGGAFDMMSPPPNFKSVMSKNMMSPHPPLCDAPTSNTYYQDLL